MLKYLIYITLLVLVPGAQAAQLSQNDVSILIPLPQSLKEDRLFRPGTKGAFGELLPLAIYSRMPDLLNQSGGSTYNQLRVVGIRLDPCFPSAPPMNGCQAQIRMMWQPLFLTSQGSLSALDAAAHTFYNLGAADFKGLISQLEKIKDKYALNSTNEALRIQPTLQKSGLASGYASELFGTILAQAGAARLSQATFMETTGGGNIWIFGGFKIAGLQVANLAIPRIQTFTQTFVNNALPARDFFSGSLAPEIRGMDVLSLLVTNSSAITPADEKAVTEEALVTFRIENPDLHNVNSMDCASCHVAQAARLWALRNYPALNLEQQAGATQFRSRYDLTNTSANPGNTMMLRAFGYDLERPAISQRTVHETATVLERLYGR